MAFAILYHYFDLFMQINLDVAVIVVVVVVVVVVILHIP